MASKRCLCSTDTSDQRCVRCNCIPIVHFLKLLTVSTCKCVSAIKKIKINNNNNNKPLDFLGNPKISINQTSNRRVSNIINSQKY